MRKARKGQGHREFDAEKRELRRTPVKKNGPEENTRAIKKSYTRELLLAGVEEEFLRANNLSV